MTVVDPTAGPRASAAPDWAGLARAWFGRRPWLLEAGLIILAVLAYGFSLLDFNPDLRLPGNEADVFQSLAWTLYHAVRVDGAFPLWNPDLLTGLPYVADPMNYAFNPLASGLVLLTGVAPGFKLAVWLSLLLVALGGWQLGRELGMGGPARVWVGLMLAFAGQPLARFFQGQYLFVLGFAWVPWALVGLFRLARTHSPRDLGLTVAALALVYFSGNSYYAFYLLLMGGLFVALTVIDLQPQAPYVQLHRQRVPPFLWLAGLAFGVIAIQFLPLLELWPRMEKSLELAGSHSPYQVFLDYTSADTLRPDAYQVLPAREEYYAYIGLSPFLALAALPLAWRRRERRPVVYFGLIALGVLAWIGLDYLPWHDWFVANRWLLQFRHLLRALIIGSLSVIVLAGLSLDSAWAWAREWLARAGDDANRLLAYGSLAVVGGLMLWGVADVYQTNRPHLELQTINPALRETAEWLAAREPGLVYVRGNPVTGWHDALLRVRLRFINAWYHFDDLHLPYTDPAQRPILAQPHYVIQAPASPWPAPDAIEIGRPGEFAVYQLPSSLPFAFLTAEAVLNQGQTAGPLTAADVAALQPVAEGPNAVRVTATATGGEYLVVLITHFPGWQVEVDGQLRPAEDLHGYLALRALAGEHTYRFVYRPGPFFVGLALSVLASLVTLALIAGVDPYAWLARFGWRGRRVRSAMAASTPLPPATAPLDAVPPARAAGPGAATPEGDPGPAVTRVHLRVDLPPGARVRITLEALHGGLVVHHEGDPADIITLPAPTAPLPAPDVEAARIVVPVPAEPPAPEPPPVADQPPVLPAAAVGVWPLVVAEARRRWALVRALPIEIWLGLGGALVLYLITRLAALEQYPIYFFTDEAIQTVRAAELVRNGGRDGYGAFLPAFFQNGPFFNLGVSVYLQVIPYLIWGSSVVVARATPALVTALGALWVGLLLWRGFKLKHPGLGVLVLAAVPAWFLHSRTAFETAVMTAFFAGFLYYYTRYRLEGPRHLYAAILLAGLAFYSYSPGQLVMLVTAGLLFLVDFGYHRQHRAVLVRGALLIGLLTVPYLRHQQWHPEAVYFQLRERGSYWLDPKVPVTEKLQRGLSEYAYGLSPAYWFFNNERDLDRHQMGDYGNFLWPMLPLAGLGLGVALRRWRSPAHRVVLVALLASPVGGALAEIGVTRSLMFVIPASLLIALGLEAAVQFGVRNVPRLARALWLTTYAALGGAAVFLLWSALALGPFWSRDYGLYGMQYGAQQVFGDVIRPALAEDPTVRFEVSPTWANAPEVFADFFIASADRARVTLRSISYYSFEKREMPANLVFVMTAAELEETRPNPKFKDWQVTRTLYYPDGAPAFQLVRLAYADNVDAIFAAEREARRQPETGTLALAEQTVTVTHSRFDAGQLGNLFDGDAFTLVRGLEANPLQLDFRWPAPRRFEAVVLTLGSMADFTVTVRVYAAADDVPQTFTADYTNLPADPTVTLALPTAPAAAERVEIEIRNNLAGETAQIHIREIVFQP